MNNMNVHVLVCLLLALFPLVTATITIAGSGERYASHPDRLVGSRWMEGYEYMARLQRIEDLSLCPTNSLRNITITPPSDGLPVVLVVKSEGCSDLTKVQVAKDFIYPRGVVKYLIIYESGPARRLGEEVSSSSSSSSWSSQDQASSELTPEEEMEAEAHLSDWQFYDERDSYESRMGVLHVTQDTGSALLKVLDHESNKDHLYGGPRVLLDGSTSEASQRFMRNCLFWIGLGLMCFGCLCSFCLSIRLSDDTAPPPAPVRPERRRLTRDQVEEWFPPFRMATTEQDNDDENKSIASRQECSICLDDFCQGDVMRQLPCFHEFHADCIGKWLVERHATCPLCKLDLLPDEEEEEEEEEPSIVDSADADDLSSVDEQESFDSHNRSFIMRFLTGWTTPSRPPPGTVDATPLLSSPSSAELQQQQQDDDDANDEHDNDSTPLLLQDQDSSSV